MLNISPATFGVCQIHTNVLVIPKLYIEILCCGRYYASPVLIVYLFGSEAAVFSVCTIIELLRAKLLDRAFLRLSDGVGRKTI